MIRKFMSDISGTEYPDSERISARNLRENLFQYIKSKHPEITNDWYFSREELNVFREQYMSYYLTQQLGELSDLEKQVVISITEHSTLAGKLDDEEENTPLKIGDLLADKVADFGGSWKFIILFFVLIMIWIVINVYFLGDKGFDPYPFILLNLFLSCIAAIQAPVIMMSQNRQEDKDRERAKKDYMINLKSEVEIHTLHEKLDQIIIQQQEEFLNIQREHKEKLDLILEKLHIKVD